MTKNYVYITKSVRKDMRSIHAPNFKYPPSGFVEAQDWSPTAECGNGLHGFLYGEGDGTCVNYSDDYVWLLLRVDPAEGLVDLSDKVKFRRGEVLQVGTYREIAQAILPFLPTDRLYKVIGLEKTVGAGGNAAGGNRSTLTGGFGSTLTGGDDSTLIGRDWAAAIGGHRSTITGGACSTLIGGWRSTLNGDAGSVLIIDFHNGDCWVRKVAIVGENGIEPNVPYCLDSNGNFIKKEMSV